jgi:hypothetical protein
MALSAAEHLASFGVSMEQALQFILGNVRNAPVILGVSAEYGVTLDMLGEIVGYSSDDVAAYFVANGLDPSPLEGGVPGPGQAFVPLVLDSLANLWTLNTRTGDLSNAALRAQAVSAVGGEANFDMIFNPVHFAGGADGVFGRADLGFSQLGPLAATQANLESLFFGTVINLVQHVDASERQAIAAAADAAVPGLVADAYANAGTTQSIPDSEIPAAAAAMVLLCWNSSGTTLFDSLVGYWV